jgi:hypothetical protein
MAALLIAADAPWMVRTLAGSALALHVTGGVVAVAAGWVAMVAKKGGRAHRLAGTVFLFAMLAMAAMIVVMAPMLTEKRWGNAIGGVLVLYLVLTGWHAAHRPAGQVGRFERAAMAAPLGIIALMAVSAVGLLPAEGGRGGVILTGLFAALLARADWSVIRRGGLAGGPRLARHLWRLGAAFFAANGSFFLGQMEHVPSVLKLAGINFAIPLAGIGLTLFWLVRTLRPRLARATGQAAA